MSTLVSFIKQTNHIIIKMARMESKILPLAGMEKLLKRAGAERVSEEAKVALRDLIEEISDEICSKAVKLAMHTGRKTVKATDIELASK